MTTATLTLEAPLPSRILAWMHERFPFANALLFFILYLTTAAVARAGEGALSLSLADFGRLLGDVVVLLAAARI